MKGLFLVGNSQSSFLIRIPELELNERLVLRHVQRVLVLVIKLVMQLKSNMKILVVVIGS